MAKHVGQRRLLFVTAEQQQQLGALLRRRSPLRNGRMKLFPYLRGDVLTRISHQPL